MANLKDLELLIPKEKLEDYGKEKIPFNFSSFLNEPPEDLPELKGAKLVGATDDGKPLIELQPNPELGIKEKMVKPFDLKSYMKDEGENPIKYDFKFNDKTNPLPISPVSTWDRLRQGFGNREGILADLKTNFDDADWDDDKGEFLVKKDGFWSKQDGDLLAEKAGRDPYQMAADVAKELAGEVAENVSTGISVAGGAAGAAAGGLPGAGLLGLGASRVNTTLGRLNGTYKNTTEQELIDNTWDGVLSILGEAIVPGGKAVLGGLGKGLSKLAKLGSGEKGVITQAMKFVSKVEPEWFDKASSNVPAFISKAAKISDEGQLGYDKLVVDQTQKLPTVAKLVNQAKSKAYTTQVSQAIKEAAEDGLTVNPTAQMDNVIKSIEDLGYGTVSLKNGQVILGDVSEETVKKFGEQGLTLPQLDEAGRQFISKELTGLMNTVVKDSSFKGNSAQFLVNFDKYLTQLPRRAMSGNVDPTLAPALSAMANQAKQTVANGFSKSPKALLTYQAAKAEYKAFLDEFSEILDLDEISKNQSELFLKKLFGSGSGSSIRVQYNSAKELLGDSAKSLMDDLEMSEAAKQLNRIIPAKAPIKEKLSGAATKYATRAFIEASEQGTSGTGKEYLKDPMIQNVRRLSQTLKSLSPKARTELISNQKLLMQTFMEPLKALEEEQGMRDATMKHIEESLK